MLNASLHKVNVNIGQLCDSFHIIDAVNMWNHLL